MNSSTNYPISFAQIRPWAKEQGIELQEARTRFGQYSILCAIASAQLLQRSLIFKGGNALDFIWEPNRSTADLDFTVDAEQLVFDLNPTTLRTHLAASFEHVFNTLETTLLVGKIEQQPPGANRTFVTFHVRICFALRDEPQLQRRLLAGESIARGIPLDISINEPICGTTFVNLDPTRLLRVSTIEDIISEKLRAILQQPVRNRTRRQDVLDIAVLVRSHFTLDTGQIGEFLVQKSAARDVSVSKAAFRSPEIAERSHFGYSDLEHTIRHTFIPFDEALAILLDFVDQLPIPE